MQPYRPPVYMANQLINQPVVLPEPNLMGIVQGYPAYSMCPTYPLVQQEPIMPTIQVQAPQTTIIKERYLPPLPPVHCHSSPRIQTTVSHPSTIINKISTPPPIINTPPPPPPPLRNIHIKRTRTVKFPQSNMMVNPSPQPVLKPAIKTITTINRTTKRTTTKGNGRR
ncbi:uncharacterized protein I303_105977 [Kwoniella dejecticola CBS 10117]